MRRMVCLFISQLSLTMAVAVAVVIYTVLLETLPVTYWYMYIVSIVVLQLFHMFICCKFVHLYVNPASHSCNT